MKEVLTGGFASWLWYLAPPQVIRLINWNIERGLQLSGIIEFLARHNADILTLQEVDLNTRRAGNRNIAEEIARALELDYAFGYEFQELAEGSRKAPAFTGQATLSRWPIRNSRMIRFSAQSKFWEPRWYKPNLPVFQERIGDRIALVSEIDFGDRSLAVFNVHLESRGGDKLRVAQLAETLGEANNYPAAMPVLIAGDMNLDIWTPAPSVPVRRAGFRDAVGLPHAITTPHGLFEPGSSIDSVLIREGFGSAEGRIHNRVRASDHFPVSCRVSLIRST